MVAIQYFAKRCIRIIFLVSAGVFFSLTLSSIISINIANQISTHLHFTIQILYAALLGFLLPGPRYALYPLLTNMVNLGFNYSVIFALICGHVLIEPSTAIIETGMFSYKFPIKRFIISLLLTFLFSVLTYYIF